MEIVALFLAKIEKLFFVLLFSVPFLLPAGTCEKFPDMEKKLPATRGALAVFLP